MSKNLKNTNRRKGFSYEYRFVETLKKQGHTNVKRNYGSLGVCDVSWINKNDGSKNEAQLKFSNRSYPHLSKTEHNRMVEYAQSKPDVKIWFVSKLARKIEIWELIK